MLASYILPRLYRSFVSIAGCLIIVLTFSDVLVRMAFVATLSSLVMLFLYMLPLMALYAIPIASGLSVQLVIGHQQDEGSALIYRFFSRARRHLIAAVALFSITITAFFIPLILTIAPRSYLQAKKSLIQAVKEQFEHLPPRLFSHIMPQFSFYFQKRVDGGSKGIFFIKPLLIIKDKQNKTYVLSAKRCKLIDESLIVYDGTMQTYKDNRWYIGTFQETIFHLEDFASQKKKNGLKEPKFCTAAQLWSQRKKQTPYVFELHRRIAHIIWQLLFPFLCLCGLFLFRRLHGRVLSSILFTAGLFLYMFITMNLAQSYSSMLVIALPILYGAPLLLFSLFCWRFYTNWR